MMCIDNDAREEWVVFYGGRSDILYLVGRRVRILPFLDDC
jgi:hypothetical protein